MLALFTFSLPPLKRSCVLISSNTSAGWDCDSDGCDALFDLFNSRSLNVTVSSGAIIVGKISEYSGFDPSPCNN